MGDEQGTAGGVRSGTFNGEIKPVSGSGTVKIGGKQVVRAGDSCTLNGGNCVGQYVVTSAPVLNSDLQTSSSSGTFGRGQRRPA